MNLYNEEKVKQLEPLCVKEDQARKFPAKRVNIISLKVIKESSLLYKGRQIRSPQDSYEIIRTFLEDADREMFVAMALDTKNQPTSIQVCHIGSLNAAIVHPREIMKMAILSNASSILVFHNHPSGHVTPSPEDHDVTKRLKAAGEIMGIETLLTILSLGKITSCHLRKRGISDDYVEGDALVYGNVEI